MSTDHKELLKFARTLLDQVDHHNDDEQPARTGAHKAYYAAYHYLKCQFPAVTASGRGGVHAQFIRGLKELGRSQTENGRAVIESAFELERLKVIRVRADYKLDETFHLQVGHDAIQAAKTILNRF